MSVVSSGGGGGGGGAPVLFAESDYIQFSTPVWQWIDTLIDIPESYQTGWWRIGLSTRPPVEGSLTYRIINATELFEVKADATVGTSAQNPQIIFLSHAAQAGGLIALGHTSTGRLLMTHDGQAGSHTRFNIYSEYA